MMSGFLTLRAVRRTGPSSTTKPPVITIATSATSASVPIVMRARRITSGPCYTVMKSVYPFSPGE